MDIIGYRFQEGIDQQKSTWRELVIFYGERVRSIKTVLFFIVSVSLLSGETVPTVASVENDPCFIARGALWEQV